MALQYEIESLESIDEQFHSFYEHDPDAEKYYLKVEGLPEPKAPSSDKNLAERLKKLEENNKALLDEKKKAKEEAEKVRLEAAKKNGNVAELEKSWQEKYDRDLAALKEETGQQLTEYQQMVSSLTVGATASSVAAEVFGEHADLMRHHVDNRLSYEVENGKPKVRVLDADGTPSALTLDDLKKEFKNNTKFAPFVVGTKASGGGAPGKKGDPPQKKRSEMSAAEKAAFLKEHGRETYLKLPK